MSTLDWKLEQDRFVRVAHKRTLDAARHAFRRWHSRKRDDAVAECSAKMWDSWSRLLIRGRNPEPLLRGLIRFAILWVRYDRRIAGRGTRPDVYGVLHPRPIDDDRRVQEAKKFNKRFIVTKGAATDRRRHRAG
jgi:hypothetical protein